MINYTICVAGDGWGALAVLKGIIGKFNKIEILTNDKEVIEDIVSVLNEAPQ